MRNVQSVYQTGRRGGRRLAAGLAMLAIALWVAAQPTAVTAQTPTPTPAASPTPTATLAPGGPGRTVTIGGFFVTPDATTAPVGDVRFNVTNVATGAHELAVIRTSLPANALPTKDGRVDEAALSAGSIAGRIAVPAGTTAAMSLNLTAGSYALICNLPRGTTNGHYASGMFSQFEVRAGGAPLGNAAPLPAPAPAAAAPAAATPAAAAGAAAPAAPKTGSAGMLVSDVASGGLLALLLLTVAVVAGGRAVVGRAR